MSYRSPENSATAQALREQGSINKSAFNAKLKAIEGYIRRDPEMSDYAIAKIVGSSRQTVGRVRRGMRRAT